MQRLIDCNIADFVIIQDTSESSKRWTTTGLARSSSSSTAGRYTGMAHTLPGSDSLVQHQQDRCHQPTIQHQDQRLRKVGGEAPAIASVRIHCPYHICRYHGPRRSSAETRCRKDHWVSLLCTEEEKCTNGTWVQLLLLILPDV